MKNHQTPPTQTEVVKSFLNNWSKMGCGERWLVSWVFELEFQNSLSLCNFRIYHNGPDYKLCCWISPTHGTLQWHSQGIFGAWAVAPVFSSLALASEGCLPQQGTRGRGWWGAKRQSCINAERKRSVLKEGLMKGNRRREQFILGENILFAILNFMQRIFS